MFSDITKKILIVLGVVALVLLGCAYFLSRTSPKNVPITVQKFSTVMEKHGFKVIKRQDDYVNMYKKGNPELKEIYYASKVTARGHNKFFIFSTFVSNEGASNAFSDVHKVVETRWFGSNVTKEFINESGLFGNTQYYSDIHAQGKMETLMFRVDNTLLHGQSEEHPDPELREICEEFGYKK